VIQKGNIEVFRDLLMSCIIIKNQDSLKKTADEILENRESTKIVSFLNFHAVNISIKDPTYSSTLKSSDYLYRDGIGVEVAMKICGQESGSNMNGTDFIPEIIKLSINKKLPIILWGTETEYLLKTKNIIESMEGSVINTMDGFQTNDAYIHKLKKLGIDNATIILGMGMPKQERLAESLKIHFPKGFSIINGGAIIDFIGGKQPRAPLLIRRLKLEFLFRLLKEPKRLYRRIVLGGIRYIFLTTLLFIDYKINQKDNT
jgi:exopolysaccharide biosynthesis WecB/TagA/CpsF family protein